MALITIKNKITIDPYPSVFCVITQSHENFRPMEIVKKKIKIIGLKSIEKHNRL